MGKYEDCVKSPLTPQGLRDTVAEKVMGWHKIDRGLPEHGETEVLDHTWVWEDDAHQVCIHIQKWRPDKDWNQMGMVIEAMQAGGSFLELAFDHEQQEWSAVFVDRARAFYARDFQYGKEIPLAVCLAAITAVEKGEGE